MDMTHKKIEDLFYSQVKIMTLDSLNEFKDRRRRRINSNSYFKARRLRWNSIY